MNSPQASRSFVTKLKLIPNLTIFAEVNIASNLRKTVYCTAIAAGSEKEWDFLWQQYLLSNNANEKSNILKALACSEEIWILQVNPQYRAQL